MYLCDDYYVILHTHTYIQKFVCRHVTCSKKSWWHILHDFYRFYLLYQTKNNFNPATRLTQPEVQRPGTGCRHLLYLTDTYLTIVQLILKCIPTTKDLQGSHKRRLRTRSKIKSLKQNNNLNRSVWAQRHLQPMLITRAISADFWVSLILPDRIGPLTRRTAAKENTSTAHWKSAYLSAKAQTCLLHLNEPQWRKSMGDARWEWRLCVFTACTLLVYF